MELDAPNESEKTSQVRIKLTTRDSDVQLLETAPILVSTALRRYALSTLVNNLLESEKPVPFEFLINGQFLRTSIDEFLTANGISAERTLTVEYVRALIPPVHISSYEHDDWVSSVNVLATDSRARILSSSYDGLLRIWNTTNTDLLATSPSARDNGHTAAVKAVKWLTEKKIASSGDDRTIRIWNYVEDEGSAAAITPVLELYGHKMTVGDIAIHTPTSQILSASADGRVGLWSTSKTTAPTAPTSLLPTASSSANKRRKLAKADNKQVSQRGPLSMLDGHTDVVSSTIFKHDDPTVGYSASWDHSVRTWDLTTSRLVDTRTTLHPLLSLTEMPQVSLLATGTTARHITLLDPRASSSKVSALTLRGHANAVSSLAVDPKSQFGLLSGSHDGSCRVWDIRSVRSVASGGGGGDGGQVGESVYVIYREGVEGVKQRAVGGEGVKVFGVDWREGVGIVSAGEDKRVQVNRPEGKQ
ncbi:WD domain, G-beta repeat-containing protein [Tothia fuscella]|uniref:Ribosome biogenesis protein YTM1 n=1 Tax=Tothia fuscella TaxID=1048955 RepID=A0A9P4P0H9_9PEZI|nr:WD domain, G-beta repeat-containing protein [Tothia fuscella]